MLPLKRKRGKLEEDNDSDSNSSFSSASSINDDDFLGGNTKVSNKSDEEEEKEAAFIRESIAKRNIRDGKELLKKTSKVKGKGKAKAEMGGGSFQSMGLHPSLLRSLTVRGYRTPTPIQRATIPSLLSTPSTSGGSGNGRDLVGMARTGSGKTLAYMVPLLHKLGGRHSVIHGARALILVPSRELAVQVLKVGRELARGWRDAGEGGKHEPEGDDDMMAETRGTGGLRWALVVGGEGMDEQFETMANNPDVIIATPGRLLHLLVEMSLSLSTIQYVVFDEADRLFEMGFSQHLTTILEKLPSTRQTVLFSATLPKTLVDFAKAGLQDPKLVRLDSEIKISQDLRMAFWSIREGERDAALLCLLRDVIKVPTKDQLENAQGNQESNKKKAKGKGIANAGAALLAPHQTLIFVSTQHHVAYLSHLLTLAQYTVSSIHGTLMQAARTDALQTFISGQSTILVTTDVAARGIDIPVLENVVNYDFPVGNRVFVHRVGRTARMGRRGWAWSFVGRDEVPFLLDLQLFLGRPLVDRVSTSSPSETAFTTSLVLAPFPRDALDEEIEYIKRLDELNYELGSLRGVMERGTKMYNKTRGKASPVSYERAKDAVKEGKWGFGAGSASSGSGAGVHPAWAMRAGASSTPRENGGASASGLSREDLLASLANFKPSETVFEMGTRGKTAGALLMKERRKVLAKAAPKPIPVSTLNEVDDEEDGYESTEDVEMADEQEIQATFGKSKSEDSRKASKREPKSFKDEEFYMSHYQKDAETERGYSLRDGATFAEQASQVTFDLTNDTGAAELKRRQSQLKWDRKKKKFVKGDGAGADNVKLIKTESGTKLPISYKSGRYEEWVKGRGRGREIRIGEREKEGSRPHQHAGGGKRWKHSAVKEAKPLDKLATDYERKMRIMKKKTSQGGEDADSAPKGKGKGKAPLGARWKGKPVGKVKNELRNVQQIRKQRGVLEKRREKNARGSKHGKGKGRR
ncbi:hypothetical protein M408DRAFT_30142 [Serendipita vermifera MAFF 305830]|uniref:RNA helicase n=1 Tax=Serendipita vermifera MAFF 305830 TaxID=933852 RepID=A0A0C3AKY7_SERVB|nr:hypothetical protein M408DRAFT_30142 [Serendipita vermifera MAFF 305830]